MKPQSFFFSIKKIFKKGKYTVELRTYSPGLNPHPIVCTHKLLHEDPSYLGTYFKDAPLPCSVQRTFIIRGFLQGIIDIFLINYLQEKELRKTQVLMIISLSKAFFYTLNS